MGRLIVSRYYIIIVNLVHLKEGKSTPTLIPVQRESEMHHRRHNYQQSHQDQYSRDKQNRPMFASPKKSGVAAPAKGPIELITNNFRIKSQNHGIIYTYRVDFIDGQAAAMIEPKNTQGGAEDQVSNVSRGSFSQLETFQKYKIINAHTQQLKQIFLQFVFVGSNLFSTSDFDSQITLETTMPFYGRYYTIVIEKCSAFLLDDLNNSKMEDHPVALSFINSIIKNSLRNSQLRQIGRNPRFFMPARAKVFQSQVEMWPGFFTSSWIFQRGLYLIIDNISKFLSVDNCLVLIQDRLQRYD